MDTETERAARAFLQRLAGRFDVSGACLFGSRAHGQYRPDSDADIAVLLHGQREAFFDTKIAMADAAYDVLLETGVLTQLSRAMPQGCGADGLDPIAEIVRGTMQRAAKGNDSFSSR